MAYSLPYSEFVLAGIIVYRAGRAHRRVHLYPDAVRHRWARGGRVGFMEHAMVVNGPIDDLEDLTEDVEEVAVPPEKLPLVE